MPENEGNFKIDWDDFEKSFYDFVQNQIPKVALEGLFAGANEALQDAIEPPYPQAPKEFGDLWGSKRVDKIGVERDKISVTMGFDIEYARRWHELPKKEEGKINWTRDKGATAPGRKFLETKLRTYASKYFETCMEYIQKHAQVKT